MTLRYEILLKRLAPAVIAWAGSLLLMTYAAKSVSLDPTNPMSWARWDSISFLTIASDGYQIEARPAVPGRSHFPWVGNTGSFPLYSYIIRLFSGNEKVIPWIAVVLANFFHVAALALLWNGWLSSLPQPAAWSRLWLAAVFPGVIYCHAISPVSLLIFLSLLTLYFAQLERWRWAALSALLAGMTHTSGVFLAFVVLAEIYWRWRQRRPFKKLLGAASAPVIGAGIIYLIQRWQTGIWDSAARVLAYHRFTRWSLSRVQHMLYLPPLYNPEARSVLIVVCQSTLVAILVMAAVYSWYRPRARASEDALRERRLILLYVLLFWIAPHCTGYWHSFYRNEAYLLPVVVVLGDLRPATMALLAGTLTIVAYLMAQLFFLNVLV